MTQSSIRLLILFVWGAWKLADKQTKATIRYDFETIGWCLSFRAMQLHINSLVLRYVDSINAAALKPVK